MELLELLFSLNLLAFLLDNLDRGGARGIFSAFILAGVAFALFTYVMALAKRLTIKLEEKDKK